MSHLKFDIADYIFLVVLIILLVFMGFLIYVGFNSRREHQKYLEEHGCQEIYRANTGRKIGVKPVRDEQIVLFECKDGSKMELE